MWPQGVVPLEAARAKGYTALVELLMPSNDAFQQL